jgi:hypothetical protein
MSYSKQASNRAKANKARATHGHASRNAHTPTYRSWTSMRQRCSQTTQIAYRFYGAKGIRVCDRWLNSFENFLADMGECPEGSSIDRINSELGYEVGNCRWATRHEQNRNRKSNVFVTIEGVTKCMSDWADKFGVKRTTAIARMRRGWDSARAVSQPVKRS